MKLFMGIGRGGSRDKFSQKEQSDQRPRRPPCKRLKMAAMEWCGGGVRLWEGKKKSGGDEVVVLVNNEAVDYW